MTIESTIPHVLLVGPPGTGKTMWARRQAAKWVIPPGETDQDRHYICQVAGMSAPKIGTPPFRAPHHTCSTIAMTGRLEQHYRWRPGELALAHGGTLFLDELSEFSSRTLEPVLRAILHGYVELGSRSTHIRTPARFRLICAANPCPCGWHGFEARPCCCRPAEVERHQARLEWFRAVGAGGRPTKRIEPDQYETELKLALAAERRSHDQTER